MKKKSSVCPHGKKLDWKCHLCDVDAHATHENISELFGRHDEADLANKRKRKSATLALRDTLFDLINKYQGRQALGDDDETALRRALDEMNDEFKKNT